jgi:pimeloyl-ACP methyl ester carboxylesterase
MMMNLGFLIVPLLGAFCLVEGFAPLVNKGMISTTALYSGRNLKIDIDGGTICYDIIKSDRVDNRGGLTHPIVYLPGLVRPKSEAKSLNLQAFCKKNGFTFLCADYYGNGRSSGAVVDGTVSRWAKDTVALIEKVLGSAHGKPVLVGHGVGTWVAFLVAMKRPDLVAGIVGLAADPDFTEELLWKKLPEDVKDRIMKEGVYEIDWGKEKYPISRNLIEDGRRNLLLAGPPGSIPVKCPVRLIHGLADEEVPISLAMKLLENTASSDSAITLLKSSTHAMENEQDMQTMRSMIIEVMTNYRGDFDLRSPGSG